MKGGAPTVAIIGRPNVGKSTLFNRLIGGRDAIVDPRPGVTRDRHFGAAEWNGRRFWLVDTGGMVPGAEDQLNRAIRTQVEAAVAASDVVLFLVDVEAGVHPAASTCVRIARLSWSSAPGTIPPVSTSQNRRPFHSAAPKCRSRVTPGRGSTIASRPPMSRLNNVDLPTLGRPMIATVGAPLIPSPPRPPMRNAECGMRN